MIPVFDSFDYFAGLFPLLIVLVPILLVVRQSGARSALIALAGLYLLFLIAPRLALFHLVFWLIVAGLQRLVAATGERRRGLAILWGSLLATLTPLVLWKGWPIEFVIDFNLWGNRVIALGGTWLEALDFNAGVIAPIGLSFAAFRAADLLIKSNLGLVDPQPVGRVLGYGLFAPLLVVGPIASFDETKATLERPVALTRQRMVDGVAQVLAGMFKVFVVAFLLDWSAEVFTSFGDQQVWRIWVALIAFTWFFYVNFAGYSDMAIGAGTLLGADLRPNFDRPFQQTNPSAFWNSWHMSLTRFLRANVYTPISAGRPNRQYFATAVTMILIALWHSVTWATLVFGIYHAVSLIGHRIVERRRPADQRRPVRLLKSVLVFVWFALSLPLLQVDLGSALDLYREMVGL